MSHTAACLARAAVAIATVVIFAGCHDAEPTAPAEADVGPVTTPSLLPRRLVFAGWPGANGGSATSGYQIYAINSNGTQLDKLTNNESHDVHSPVWSSGPTYLTSKIAYHLHCDCVGGTDISAKNHLYVMSPDGSNKLDLTPNGFHETREQVWSPDGTRLAFVERTALDIDQVDFQSTAMEYLTVVNADGTGLRHIAKDSTKIGSPTWSPDGQRLAYYEWSDYPQVAPSRGGIFLINADGSGRVRLVPSSSGLSEVQFSPTGSKLVVTGGYGLEVMNADGSGVIATRVCGWEAFCHHARWSPDGTRILFTRGLTGDNTIWTIHRDGGGQVQVVANGHSDNAEWSRDGALIAYEHEDSDAGLFYPDIWVAPADGSSHARVTFDMNGVEPSWGP